MRTPFVRPLRCAALSTLVGCGAAPAANGPPGEVSALLDPTEQRSDEPDAASSNDLEVLGDAVRSRELALADSLAAADCAHACEHLSALCELSERICTLAEAEPDPELDARCSDARERCGHARFRARASCHCEP